jgi:hypothetical protein
MPLALNQPPQHRKLGTVSSRRPSRSKPRTMMAMAVAAAISGVAGVSQANTADNVTGTLANTALDSGINYGSTPSLPGTTNDVVFTVAAAYNGSFTLNTTALSIATLNDLSTTVPITIAGTQSFTLNGGSNVTTGSTASDVLFVATGGVLNLNAPFVLATSGNFDVAGTGTISGAISGSSFGFTKTGSGLLTLPLPAATRARL